MGAYKETSKNGGYVGGFFQLFDWTAKSRKKLFSSKIDFTVSKEVVLEQDRLPSYHVPLYDWTAKSRKKLFSSKTDFPECSKQGKKNDGNLPMTRVHLIDDEEVGASNSIKGSGDYSCASSVTDDDLYGSKAPNVVARLMGLDSLPTSNASEPYSSPFFDTQSHRDACYCNKNFEYHHDQQVTYSGNLFNKIESSSRNFMESRPPQKTMNRPIEKFLAESLPPKSAKSIPITHHKLLSPIKSPGFILTKDAARIMEEAARIIEPCQATSRSKMPLVGTSSVPLKVRDMKDRLGGAQKMSMIGSSSLPLKVRDVKEKVEASHRTPRVAENARKQVESNAAKLLKGQSMNRSWNGSMDTTQVRVSETEESSTSSKNKGKSVSLAIQAKVNVQKRGLTSGFDQNLLSQKDHNDVKLSKPFKSQQSMQKNLHKKLPTPITRSVLRQNNQKQNCMLEKEKLPSRPTVANQPGKKMESGNSLRRKNYGKQASSSKTGLRKFGLDTTDDDKGDSCSSTKNVPRKKRMTDGDYHAKPVGNITLVDGNWKAVQSIPATNTQFNWIEDSKKKGMDVVSFTFTAPLTRPVERSSQPVHNYKSDFGNSQSKRSLLDMDGVKTSLGYDSIGGDALSLLLEQKLRELSCAVESSSHVYAKAGSSSTSMSSLQKQVQVVQTISNEPMLYNKLGSVSDSYLSITDLQALKLRRKSQGVDEMDECVSSSNSDARQPSPVSVLEPYFLTESYNSSESMDSNSVMEVSGSKHCSSVQAQELRGLSSSKKLRSTEADMDLSDSASSASTEIMARKSPNLIFMIEPVKAANWELEYIKQILYHTEFMFVDFALGRTHEIVNPLLFNQLEGREAAFGTGSPQSKLERKVLFDSVSECLDIRCRLYVNCGHETWSKGVAMLRRKGWLAEEVYKDISGWRGMGDCNVDELVDKDMSSQYGKWLDFDLDTFELGMEVDGHILDSLLDEVIVDILKH